MTETKFVEAEDVTARYEGTFPTERTEWVELRIIDAEAELMGQVPSLRKPLDEIIAESTAAGDPTRVDRVRRLICDKVLALYRNPDGATQVQRTMPDLTSSRSYGFYRDDTRGKIAFDPTELDTVRLHRRRPRFGTITMNCWHTQDRTHGRS